MTHSCPYFVFVPTRIAIGTVPRQLVSIRKVFTWCMGSWVIYAISICFVVVTWVSVALGEVAVTMTDQHWLVFIA